MLEAQQDERLREVWIHKDISERTFAQFKADCVKSAAPAVDNHTLAQQIYARSERALNSFTFEEVEVNAWQ